MKKVPTYINIVSFWVLQIPVAYLLAKYWLLEFINNLTLYLLIKNEKH